RPRGFDQMGAHLFEQVSALFGRQGLDQLLLGRRQNALEANHEEIAEQVGADVLGPAAHVILLEAGDALGDGGFDFSLRLHGKLARGRFSSNPANVRARVTGRTSLMISPRRPDSTCFPRARPYNGKMGVLDSATYKVVG